MKPAPFDYVRVSSVREACEILAADPNARLISGGQTLVPMLAMRLARPSILIDIARLPSLWGISRDDAAVTVGAATTQAAALASPIVRRDAPLLAAALPWVGHPPTRARGTVGGSLANADPAAEIALVAATLRATLVIEEMDAVSTFAADDFFIGPMLTLAPQAGCIVRVDFPIWPYRRLGVGFHEISSRRSDFALVSAAAQIALDDGGVCRAAALGIGGAGDMPLRLDVDALVGEQLTPTKIRDVTAVALTGVDTFDDLHASAAYRHRVAQELAVRALSDAVRTAQQGELMA